MDMKIHQNVYITLPENNDGNGNGNNEDKPPSPSKPTFGSPKEFVQNDFIFEPVVRRTTWQKMQTVLNNTIKVKWSTNTEQEFEKEKIIVLSFPFMIRESTIQSYIDEEMPSFFKVTRSTKLVDIAERKKFNAMKKRQQKASKRLPL